MIRAFVIALAAGAALAASGGDARAAGGCSGPFCNQPAYPSYHTLLGHRHQNLPAFQAAPWYLYWPYDGHFLTPAPISGAFYGPPTPGNFPVNPYFPAPGYGGYGSMPGGPVPYPHPQAPVAPPRP